MMRKKIHGDETVARRGRFFRSAPKPRWDKGFDDMEPGDEHQRVGLLHGREIASERAGLRRKAQGLLLVVIITAVTAVGLRSYATLARDSEDLSEMLARDRITSEVRNCKARNAFRSEVRALFEVLSDPPVDPAVIEAIPSFAAIEDENAKEFVRVLIAASGQRSLGLAERQRAYVAAFPLADCNKVEADLERRYNTGGN